MEVMAYDLVVHTGPGPCLGILACCWNDKQSEKQKMNHASASSEADLGIVTRYPWSSYTNNVKRGPLVIVMPDARLYIVTAGT